MACPDANALLEFAEGALEAEATKALEGHLDGCTDCRRTVFELMRDATPLTAARRPQTLSLAGAPLPDDGPDEPLAHQGRVGRYVIQEVVGRGGMGVVYVAHDPELNRRVAVKLIRRDVGEADSQEDRSLRLLREAQAMARLSHPNVVSVFDVGTFRNQVFMAMELVEGETAGEWARGQRRSWQEVVAVYLQAGRGLAAAHGAGLVHRDFKPENVLLGKDGVVRVTDFGLARPTTPQGVVPIEPGSSESVDSGSSLGSPVTRTGVRVGTPLYMAPEQHRGEAVDARSDQFSFCVALYEALYGDRPFKGKTVGELKRNLERGPREPPPGAKVPNWLRALVSRGLQADPAQRFPSMEALIAELTRDRWRRWRVVAIASAALLVLLLGVGSATWLRLGRVPSPVLVTADTTNHTNDAEFNELSGLLVTALQQSPRLQLLDRSRSLDALRRAGQADPRRVDQPAALLVARAAKASHVLVPSVSVFAERYTLHVDVLDARVGEVLFSLDEAGDGKASVLGSVDRIALVLRRRLDESERDIGPNSQHLTASRSMDAYQVYAKGLEAWSRGDVHGSLGQFQKAAALDADFAMAHYRVATCLSWIYEAGAREAMDKALKKVNELPERERALIRAFDAFERGQRDEALRRWSSVLERYPDDPEALWWSGDTLLHSYRPDEALARFQRLTEVEPRFVPAQEHGIRAAWVVGRFDVAEALARHLGELQVGPSVLDTLISNHMLAGRFDEAERIIHDGMQRWPGWTSFLEGDGALANGHLSKVDALVERWARVDTEEARSAADGWRFQARVARGQYQEALKQAEKGTLKERSRDSRAGLAISHAHRALLLEGLGEKTRALGAVAASMEHGRHTSPAGVWLLELAAWIVGEDTGDFLTDRLHGSPDALLARRATTGCRQKVVPEGLLAELERGYRGSVGGPRFFFGYLLMQCAAKAGDDARVLQAYERFWFWKVDPYTAGLGMRIHLLPRAQALAARAYARRGETDKARAIWEELLRRFEEADPGLPLLLEARRAMRELPPSGP